MNSLLGNMRWLCLPSENLGHDWFDKGREIDSLLPQLGLDLAEESTFLIFSTNPSDVLEGRGQCLVARPVIGPKKSVEAPLALLDWKAAPVWQETLQGETLVELLENAEEARLKAQKGQRPFADSFSLCVRRRLTPELRITVDSIFHE